MTITMNLEPEKETRLREWLGVAVLVERLLDKVIY